MERSGRRRALLRGEGLTDAQPREGEPDGGHRGAEAVGCGAFELGCWGWVVVRLVVCWPVSCEVVVVVDIGLLWGNVRKRLRSEGRIKR